MRSQKILLLTILATLVPPAAAWADFGHVMAAAGSLWAVAAADGLSVSQLAAANGLSSDSTLTAGATLQIPPQDASTSTSASAPGSGSATAPSQSSSSVASGSAGSSGGGYTVAPGDTLSAIAAQYGT